MATATKTRTNFRVSCPSCHDEDATLAIDLANINEITCSSCDSKFSAREAYDQVEKELARWAKVIRWAELASEVLADEAE